MILELISSEKFRPQSVKCDNELPRSKLREIIPVEIKKKLEAMGCEWANAGLSEDFNR